MSDRFIMEWTQGCSRAIFEMRRVRLYVVGNSCRVVTALVGGILWRLCHHELDSLIAGRSGGGSCT